MRNWTFGTSCCRTNRLDLHCVPAVLLGLVVEVPLATGELMICLSVGEEQDRAVPPFKQGVKYISRLAQLFSKSPCPSGVQLLQGWTPTALSAPRLRVF